MFVPIFRLAKYFVKPVDRRKSTSLYKLALCYKYFSGLQLRFNSSIYIYIYIFDQNLWPLACLPCFWWLHSNPSLAKQKPSLPLLWTPSSENIEKLRGWTLEGKPQQFE